MNNVSNQEIVLRLDSVEELFASPPPGRVPAQTTAQTDWDAVGATLGEPGTSRLMRQLFALPQATSIVVRINGASGSQEHQDRTQRSLRHRLENWMRAQATANRAHAQTARRFGARSLVICTLVLGGVLALAWLLKHESLLGTPGLLRSLIAEALVIAGWVVMWRPIEQLVFDPMRPDLERRQLERALRMPVNVQWTNDPSAGDASV